MPALIVAGLGALAGGAMGASASKRAAEVQAQSQREAALMQLAGTREGNALLASMYGNQLRLQAPQLRAGQTALSALMSGMGLGPLQVQASRGPTGDVGGAPGAVGVQGSQYLDSAGRPYNGPVRTDASGNPVDAAGNRLTAIAQFEAPSITQEEAEAAASPYAGTFLEKFTGQDLYRDPSYQFRLSEGERLLRARQAAGGNRFGGQAMKDIVNYGQEAASQEYGSAFDRFMRTKQSLYERLAGIAGTASPIAGGLGEAGSTMAGRQAGNIMTGTGAAAGNIANAGTALGGGIVGSTNALVGGLTGAANTWLSNQYFNQINRGGGFVPGRAPGISPGGYTGFEFGGRP